MSSALHADLAAPPTPVRPSPRRTAIARAVLALVWAAALALAVGGKVPTTGAGVPTGAALLLASYPLIDVIASLLDATFGDARVLRVNAAVGGLAVAGIAVAAFASDAGAVLAAFGAWAAVSGVLMLVVAIRRRRTHDGRWPLIASGAISTVAGLSFLAASGNDEAHLGGLAAYMAFGAVLFLLWAWRTRAAST